MFSHQRFLVQVNLWFVFPLDANGLGRCEHSNRTRVRTKTTGPKRTLERLVCGGNVPRKFELNISCSQVCFAFWDAAEHTERVSTSIQDLLPVFTFLLLPQTHLTNKRSERSHVVRSDGFFSV